MRGHQVRKNYGKIVWSVGILEKVILRWRRKGSGLRGFKSEAISETMVQDVSCTEDDYDFLREGRKQTEKRLQKALARVKSMVQYPEARDQYHRLLNVVTEIQENQVFYYFFFIKFRNYPALKSFSSARQYIIKNRSFHLEKKCQKLIIRCLKLSHHTVLSCDDQLSLVFRICLL